MKNFKIVLGGHKIPVEFVTELKDGDLGEFCPDTLTIRLAEDNPQWKMTLIHEVCHAFLEISGWVEKFDLRDEEHFCKNFEYFFAPLVHALLK